LAIDELIAPLCIGEDATRIAPLMLEIQIKVYADGNLPPPGETHIG
jgi:hypothetical protein